MDPLIYKTLLVGDQAVGKSSLLLQYTTEEFRKDYTVTIGLEFGSKEIILDGKNPITIQIWDTVNHLYKGRLDKKPLKASLDHSTETQLLCLSFTPQTNAIPFRTLKIGALKLGKTPIRMQSSHYWETNAIQNSCIHDMFMQVVKSDLKRINADLFFETSGKEAKNLDEAFRETAKLINKRFHENEQFRRSIVEEEEKEHSMSQPRQSLVKNSRIENQPKKKSGCC